MVEEISAVIRRWLATSLPRKHNAVQCKKYKKQNTEIQKEKYRNTNRKNHQRWRYSTAEPMNDLVHMNKWKDLNIGKIETFEMK